jgi:hypothetical protein
MTGCVEQVFTTDDSWNETLRAAHSALRPGGRIAFESRNPTARAWESWNPKDSFEELDHSEFGHIASWHEVTDVSEGTVTYQSHTRFDATGDHLRCEDVLAFRSHDELTKTLSANGFTVRNVFRDWNRTPYDSDAKVMVFVATRN